MFDALTNDRPYRKAFLPEKALLVMHNDLSGSEEQIALKEFRAVLAKSTAVTAYQFNSR